MLVADTRIQRFLRTQARHKALHAALFAVAARQLGHGQIQNLAPDNGNFLNGGFDLAYRDVPLSTA